MADVRDYGNVESSDAYEWAINNFKRRQEQMKECATLCRS